jgi:hypothetical protein
VKADVFAHAREIISCLVAFAFRDDVPVAVTMA